MFKQTPNQPKVLDLTSLVSEMRRIVAGNGPQNRQSFFQTIRKHLRQATRSNRALSAR